MKKKKSSAPNNWTKGARLENMHPSECLISCHDNHGEKKGGGGAKGEEEEENEAGRRRRRKKMESTTACSYWKGFPHSTE